MSIKKKANKDIEDIKNIIIVVKEQMNEMKKKIDILTEHFNTSQENFSSAVKQTKITTNSKKKILNTEDIKTKTETFQNEIKILQNIDELEKKIEILTEHLDSSQENSSSSVEQKKATSNFNKNILNTETIKKRNKKTKAQTFKNERKIFIDELEKKVGLTEHDRGITLYELEKNEELKKYLKNKIPEIQKIYKCGSWNYFLKLNSNSKVSEISLLKSIFKNENFNLLNKKTNIVIEGNKQPCTKLFFIKKNL